MNTNFCPTCKSPIPADAPGGYCPACILRDADEGLPGGRTAPSLEVLAAAFPQLEVLELIGQGGMGFVYKVRQPSLDRTVALKILSPELGRDPAFAERFAREARVLGKLSHPNIVTVFESGESGGFFYLLMEFVDGVNLRQAMRAGRFTPAQALAVVPGICDALAAAHAQGVWHRDIKPENILLDAQGGVKIVDFGIARIVGDPRRDFTLTLTGAALGSAAYMAPEQHERPHDVDHRADIYSLGVVIYEMLTGELPLGRFAAPSTKAAVDARIDEIVLRTLEKERELRQQSAAEVKTEVTRAASEPAPPRAPDIAASPSFRFPKAFLASAALLIGGLVIGGTGWFIFANLREARALGAVLGGLGSLFIIFGLIAALWSLHEIRRASIPAAGRKLLISLVIVPAVIGCLFAAMGSALATGVPAVKGSILVLASLIIAGLAISLSLVFKLARPLGEATPRRRKLARASLAGSAIALAACAVVSKRSDYTWPHVFHKETATLKLNREFKPTDEELLALLKRAAGPQSGDLELSVKNGHAKVTAISKYRPFSGGTTFDVEKSSYAQACLARLRDLLPAAAIHWSRIDSEIPVAPFESRFRLERGMIAVLASLGALLATLAGGSRAVKVLAAGIALHLLLIPLPAWQPGGGPPIVPGVPLPLFTAAEFAGFQPDFSTPDKAVTSVYDAACWGNREAARRGMSKALIAGLDAQDGWDEFFERNRNRRMVATFSPKAKPDGFYNQLSVQTSYIDRRGIATSGDSTWVVEEDGGWRLDQLTYIGRNGEINAPATWFANKEKNKTTSAGTPGPAAPGIAQPPPVAIKPDAPADAHKQVESQKPLELILKMNELANAGNAAEFKRYLPAKMDLSSIPQPNGRESRLTPPSDAEVARHLSAFAGETVGVWNDLPNRTPARPGRIGPPQAFVASPLNREFMVAKGPAAALGATEKQYIVEHRNPDGSTAYRAVVFGWGNAGWAFSHAELLPYTANARVEFLPAEGDPRLILSELASGGEIRQVFANGVPQAGRFDLQGGWTGSPEHAVESVNHLLQSIEADLKQAGTAGALKILSPATPPEKPGFFEIPGIQRIHPRTDPEKEDEVESDPGTDR